MRVWLIFITIFLIWVGWYFWSKHPSERLGRLDREIISEVTNVESHGILLSEPDAQAKVVSAAEQESKEIKKMSQDEAELQFEKVADRIFREIPSKEDLQALPDSQTHHTPEVIFRVAEQFGELATVVARHPYLTPKAMAFYHSCALTERNPNSIRALCYGNYQRLALRLGDSSGFPGEERLPQAVRLLSQSSF